MWHSIEGVNPEPTSPRVCVHWRRQSKGVAADRESVERRQQYKEEVVTRSSKELKVQNDVNPGSVKHLEVQHKLLDTALQLSPTNPPRPTKPHPSDAGVRWALCRLTE